MHRRQTPRQEFVALQEQWRRAEAEAKALRREVLAQRKALLFDEVIGEVYALHHKDLRLEVPKPASNYQKIKDNAESRRQRHAQAHTPVPMGAARPESPPQSADMLRL